MKRLIAIATLTGMIGGCGLLDATNEIWIELPAQTFEFDLDAGIVRAMLEAELGTSLAGMEEFPAGVDFDTSLELETPPKQVDLSSEQELKKYIEAGKVKSVKITYVKYNIDPNTLSYDIPEMKMYLDDHGAAKITESSDLVATLPTVPAKTTQKGEVQWTPNGQKVMSDYLLALKFAVMGKALLEIDTAKNRSIPSGQLHALIQVGSKFSVDPL